MLAKIKLFYIYIVALLILSGCWDSVDIEDRAFTVGIAVDLTEESGKFPTLQMTQQVIVPAVFSTSQSTPGKAYRNLDGTGETIFEINRKTTNHASTKLSVTHLKVVLFSEDVVTEEKVFANLMDVFLREMEMRRTINVAIVSENAKNILDVEPEHELVPAIYIDGLLANEESLITIKSVRLGEVHENLLLNYSFLIPQIKKLNDTNAEYEGLAIFHGPSKKVIGTLKEDKAKGVVILTGGVRSGSIDTNIDGKKIANEILHVKSDIALKNKDKNNLQFDINLTVKSGIAEVLGSVNVLSQENYEQIKKALEDEIEKLVTQSIDTVQNDMNADVLGLNKYLNQDHYKFWQSIKDNWEEGEGYFAKSNIEVKVNVIIDQSGNINKAQ